MYNSSNSINRGFLNEIFGQTVVDLVIRKKGWDDSNFIKKFETYIIEKLKIEEEFFDFHSTSFSYYEDNFMRANVDKSIKNKFQSFKNNIENHQKFIKDWYFGSINGQISQFIQIHYFAMLKYEYVDKPFLKRQSH